MCKVDISKEGRLLMVHLLNGRLIENGGPLREACDTAQLYR